LKRHKREWAGDVAKEAENIANLGNMKGEYDATRKLCNERPRINITMPERIKRRQVTNQRR